MIYNVLYKIAEHKTTPIQIPNSNSIIYYLEAKYKTIKQNFYYAFYFHL